MKIGKFFAYKIVFYKIYEQVSAMSQLFLFINVQNHGISMKSYFLRY